MASIRFIVAGNPPPQGLGCGIFIAAELGVDLLSL